MLTSNKPKKYINMCVCVCVVVVVAVVVVSVGNQDKWNHISI